MRQQYQLCYKNATLAVRISVQVDTKEEVLYLVFSSLDISAMFCFRTTRIQKSKKLQRCPKTRPRTKKQGTKSVFNSTCCPFFVWSHIIHRPQCLLIQFGLFDGSFGQSNTCTDCTFHFCSSQKGIKCNATLEKLRAYCHNIYILTARLINFW